MKKVLVVFGTRPEAIKMAPVVKEFQKFPDQFCTKVCVTAQHRQMLDQVLDLFNIKPDYDLDIMEHGQDLYDVTYRVLLGIRDVLVSFQPDLVLVHGDTTTSTATALATFYQQIPVAHIEAGLRTNNIYSPWPEEMNRQITGRIATHHFAPTSLSKRSLLDENIDEENIHVVGNTVIDALLWVTGMIKGNAALKEKIINELVAFGLPNSKLSIWDTDSKNNDQPDNRKLVLITGHRRENFGQGFINICKAIKDLGLKYPGVDFVYPMHMNPNVRQAIEQIFGSLSEIRKNAKHHNVYFIEPLEYQLFVYLMSISDIVLTDSGGIQEEAPGLGKPVLVMRETTERQEAVDAGTVELVGTSYDAIKAKVGLLLENQEDYDKMSRANNPYGDGSASKQIVDFFKSLL